MNQFEHYYNLAQKLFKDKSVKSCAITFEVKVTSDDYTKFLNKFELVEPRLMLESIGKTIIINVSIGEPSKDIF